ncbi:hypothetical protein [Cellulophaga sp. L1A9]|uniref:hypothetical protein n=1 Tax=Cellulophaga sp. L1A9 TaxID=2686362 RepID=UPI00131EC676|nr:hypothetical protein [Cellulophaga sp. L1A9]
MKHKIILIALTTLFISCSNDKKTSETAKHVAIIKSDLLLTNSAVKAFSGQNNTDTLTILINGKSLLQSTATLKVTNDKGEELLCDTLATTRLLNPDYRTANSALKDAQIRETVSNLFTTNEYLKYFKQKEIASNQIK